MKTKESKAAQVQNQSNADRLALATADGDNVFINHVSSEQLAADNELMLIALFHAHGIFPLVK